MRRVFGGNRSPFCLAYLAQGRLSECSDFLPCVFIVQTSYERNSTRYETSLSIIKEQSLNRLFIHNEIFTVGLMKNNIRLDVLLEINAMIQIFSFELLQHSVMLRSDRMASLGEEEVVD